MAGAGGAIGAAGAVGGAGGNGGTPNAAGAAGAPVDPGNLMSFIPTGYTGTPYGGTPQTIPGKIEVEKYDLGGLNVAFKASTDAAFNRCGLMRATDAIKLQCTGQAGPQDQNYADCTNYPAGSVYIGYINTGDWYKYTVDVVEAGTYVISGHEGVAANTQMQFTFTDAEKTQAITLPATGGKCTSEAYHVWAVQDNLGEIALTPGRYVLTINVLAAAMNLDWFAFTKKP
jgi:endo-1,4-beta-xylanase